VLVLDWWYRCLVKDRTHFERVPQGVPSLRRALTFLVFPVADVVFHVIPTWHAYLKMFLSTGFEYEVAAKGALPSLGPEPAQASEGDLIAKRVQAAQEGSL